jgi:hypothetical protein
MSHLPQQIDEQECQQDTLRRVNTWLNTLEKRIAALLQDNDPQALKPGEREQAISRHLAMLLRLLQYRQKLTRPDQSAPSPAEQALLDALLHNSEDL